MKPILFTTICMILQVFGFAQSSEGTVSTDADSNKVARVIPLTQASTTNYHVDVANVVSAMPHLITGVSSIFHKKDRFDLGDNPSTICFKNKRKTTLVVFLKNQKDSTKRFQPIFIAPKAKGNFCGLLAGVYRYSIYEDHVLKAESELNIELGDNRTIKF